MTKKAKRRWVAMWCAKFLIQTVLMSAAVLFLFWVCGFAAAAGVKLL